MEEGMMYVDKIYPNGDKPINSPLLGLTDSDVEYIQDLLENSSDEDGDEFFEGVIPRPMK